MMKKLYAAILLIFLLTTSALAEVNINTASKEELNALPGIGPVKAEAIIKYRQEKGPFKSVDELKNVYGIGDKLFARLKSEISVGSPDVATESDKPAPAATQTKVETEAPAASEKKEAAAPEKQAKKP
jgi:competence protein ComEA